jgi:hypothetical protein
VAYYKFDEGSGTASTDSSGNNNNGTWSGSGTHYATAKVGSYSGQFNGSDDAISVPFNSSLQFGINFTFSLWAKFNNLGSGAYYDHYNSFVYRDPGQSIFFATEGHHIYTSVRTSVVELRSPDNLITGTWYFITITYDGSYRKIYVNGVEVASVSCSGTPETNSGPMLIGRYIYGPSFMDGVIDEISFYNRTLSATEIQNIYSHQY